MSDFDFNFNANIKKLGRCLARRLVEEIENEHGHISEDTLRQIDNPAIREKLANALKAKDGMIGSTVITYRNPSHPLATMANFLSSGSPKIFTPAMRVLFSNCCKMRTITNTAKPATNHLSLFTSIPRKL